LQRDIAGEDVIDAPQTDNKVLLITLCTSLPRRFISRT